MSKSIFVHYSGVIVLVVGWYAWVIRVGLATMAVGLSLEMLGRELQIRMSFNNYCLDIQTSGAIFRRPTDWRLGSPTSKNANFSKINYENRYYSRRWSIASIHPPVNNFSIEPLGPSLEQQLSNSSGSGRKGDSQPDGEASVKPPAVPQDPVLHDHDHSYPRIYSTYPARPSLERRQSPYVVLRGLFAVRCGIFSMDTAQNVNGEEKKTR
ncbi:hypothetical protein BU17DRAFT_60024 [Hysterangium stoloniferum]|nr:hypothetical protein BU17DRAFT_60024 [Hysterangium stoloniferum]